MRKTADNIVISDVRFPNEIKAIHNAGGKVIWVQRGELPSWHIMATKANNGDMFAAEKLKALGVHASETAWVGKDIDFTVSNNGSIDDLFNQIKSLVLDRPVAKAA
jgi:hypothetical protein